ncbi:molybdopterin oxidoreductase family protein [Algisphaera agarilytica]|uniref:Anaerobic selenocysteine-containing dehydrogenase n=1 Tax=Algisphaera agarilytica TaxID=1385975 RepID=A0A7X0HAQ5_9BACT|nr:nitrate reductase [Algisphaera agarilytica]MBB6431256.1 anaerobic selenocysteine-containing dehydrogenase [Algisphaera agarilytica]
MTRATCPYCGVGCVVEVKVQGGQMKSIHADVEAAPNFGMMCPKGALLFKSDDASRRLTEPMIRDEKGGPLRPATWAEAIRKVADGIKDTLTQRGPDAVAWYGSGQLDTEASFLFTKLFKGYLGSNHTDTNSRLCMSSAVAGYVRSFGSDGPPTCYEDMDLADTFFLIGANMTANHPVLFNRIRRRRATHEGTRIIVVDPRRSKTAEFADLHLAVKPGGDVALLRLLAKAALDRGDLDLDYIEQSVEGFAELKQQLDELDVDAMLDACGVPAADIEQAAEWMGGGRKLLSCYCMGTNQSSRGTDKNTALIDLHLMLGQVGKPGAGPFSLTGQPNAMGGREVGYLAHQLPGYRKVTVDADREALEQAWGLAEGSIAAEPGRPAVEMFDAAARGELGVLWVACTNPAVSMPDLDVTQHGLRETPLVVVQDCLKDTETAAYADVLLPAATWGEKRGTMTNSERLITRSDAALPIPGEARTDWKIVCDIAQAMGFHGFDFADSDEVWDEFRRLTADTLCDMTGITNEQLDQHGGTHWPYPAAAERPTLRRYVDGVFPTPSGKARLSTASYEPTAETADDEYPLNLTTGRVAQHWHTRGRTGHVPELNRFAPHPVADVHPSDAGGFGLVDGDLAWVESRHGRALAEVSVTTNTRPGLVFLPFHFGDTLHPETAANYATHRVVDAISKQPELKHAACRLVAAPNETFANLDEGSRNA